AVLDHIEACLVEPAHTERDDVHDAIGEAIDELATTPELPPLDEPVDIPAVPMREFVFQQGTSNKFWRIGINGTDVVVLFGRIGSRGQKLTKSYTSLGRAQREVSKLVEEKLNKGYIEKSGD
ncbi:MAG TPA: WGR domain-containing protein, partial [Xanthomonadaceae bacterium]|nr:WGR domain-containing protein [Xanthomonadaceae bacterium]